MLKLLTKLFYTNTIKQQEPVKIKNSKQYVPEFLDDNYADAYSLISYEGIGYFNFKKYFRGSYDDDDITIKILFPSFVKELIDTIGIKNKSCSKLYYELEKSELILNNNWTISLYVLSKKTASSMSIDSKDIIFAVGVKSPDSTVYCRVETLNEKTRSNSYGMDFISEGIVENKFTQFGLNEIFKVINKSIDIDHLIIKGDKKCKN